jgi:hypothetical protein
MCLTRVHCTGLVLLCLTGAVQPSLAQDDHYWRNAYGTESTLLNGMVIGRSLDLGALFYNPSGLAEVENAEVVLSAQIFEYSKLKAEGVDEFTGEPLTAGEALLRPAPGFFGGTVPFPFLGRHRVGYSVLTRQQAESRLSVRGSEQVDGQLVQSEYVNDNELNEVWVGLTWAYPLSARWSVGATLFTAVRSQLLRRQVTAQALRSDGSVALASGISEFEYNSWRLVPKLGITYDLSKLTLGATVTVPSLGLWGSGTSLFNATSSGIDIDDDRLPEDQLASNFQDGVASNFLSGLAVGIGGAVDIGQTTLFLSSEWFAPRGPTRVLETAPFEAQSTGEALTHDLVLRTSGVVNVGGGVRHRFSPRFAGYLSAATDLSSIDTTARVSVGRTPWDLYHVGVGAKFTVSRLDLIVGLNYTTGGAEVDLDSASGIPVFGAQDLSVRERGIRVLFGFQYGFGRAEPRGRTADPVGS